MQPVYGKHRFQVVASILPPAFSRGIYVHCTGVNVIYDEGLAFEQRISDFLAKYLKCWQMGWVGTEGIKMLFVVKPSRV